MGPAIRTSCLSNQHPNFPQPPASAFYVNFRTDFVCMDLSLILLLVTTTYLEISLVPAASFLTTLCTT